MHFADLIDSVVNIVEDGIGRAVDEGFRISPLGYSKRLLSFFESSQHKKSSWFISLNDSNAQGLSIQEEAAGPRLTIAPGGQVGIGTSSPAHKLEVKGSIAMESRVGVFASGFVPGDGKWHDVLSGLNHIQAFEVMAKINGRKGSGKYAVLHALALSAYGGRLSHSKIRTTAAYYGSWLNQIQVRWVGTVNNFALQLRTRGHYGLDDKTAEPFQLQFHITRLWDEEEPTNQ